jgi:hypothetical protein
MQSNTFQSALEGISHAYLYRPLWKYGISEWFIERIQTLHTDATASVQINGTLAGRISIQVGVRQGCPLSVIMYAPCLHFLHSLADLLPPLRIGQRTRYVPALANTDDVTVFVTKPVAFTDIQQAIRHERATWALLNTRKSKALDIGNRVASATKLRTDLHDYITIFSVTLCPLSRNP